MARQEPLQAAAVEVDITPPVGVWMEGYGERQEPSIGVHDPLLGQVLILTRGDQGAALISLDLIGVRPDFTARLRSAIAQACAIPEAAIMVACSHTHGGPTGFLTGLPLIHSPADPDLVSVVERKLTGAAMEAVRELRPARFGIGHGRLRGLGANRNNPEAVLDDEVIVMRLDGDDGRPMAVWMNYGCHPTVMGHENLFITADYPGAARKALRKVYPECIFMYANGASGDVSTRFTRRAQTFDEVDRMGRLLAGEVLKVMESVECENVDVIEGLVKPIEFPFRRLPAESEILREIESLQSELAALREAQASHGDIRRAETRLEGALALQQLAREVHRMDGYPSQLQLLRVGPLRLIGLPGEPFTQTVLDIKAKSPYPHVVVVSYCNEEAGYFPDRRSFAEGTYEALIAPYREDVAELLVDRALAMLGGS